MAFPPGVAAKTVTIGTASFFDGTIAEGTVTVTAPVNVLHTPSNRPLFSSQMSKRFVNGEATFDLVPTDHPDLNRRDFSYKMVVTIQGALVQPDPINFLLPVAGPDIVDLDGLVTVPSSAGTPISVDALTTADLPPLVDDGGPFSDALRGALVSRAASPRDTQRVAVERKPVLVLDQVFPNAYVDHKIVWVQGDDTLWAVGHDNSLRTSPDSGATWGRKLGNSGNLGSWAKDGLFFRTSAGTLLTTYHPYDLTAPKIQRSTDGGATWTDVVAAQTNVDYLGPTSIAQDPDTGYLYLIEYVTVSADTKATWKISRSTDDGATWTTFATFQRDATANPTTAVRHGHGCQWDPEGLRMWFACGDAEQAAGLYRVNAAGDGVEVAVKNSPLPTGVYAGAVGLMFFPTHIAWGIDQSSDSWLLRMNRDQIGQATPVVEKVARLQSTAFYCIRTAADNTEWLMSVSSENTGTVGRLDNAVHWYRVADNGATLDEVMAEASPSSTTFFWSRPVGDPLYLSTGGRFWLASNVKARTDRDVNMAGWQASGRLAWGTTPAPRPEMHKRPFYEPVSQSSGLVTLAASAVSAFGVLRVPIRTRRLYIIDAGAEKVSGTGVPYFELWNTNTGARVNMAGTSTAILDRYPSMRTRLNEDSAPYVYVTDLLTADHILHLRLLEGVGTAGCDATGFFTYAWGL